MSTEAIEIAPRDRQAMAVTGAALTRYRHSGQPQELGRAFASAAKALEALRREHDLSLTECRELFSREPVLRELMEAAVAHAEQVVMAGGTALWGRLGLAGSPPGWDSLDREAARAVLSCACAAGNGNVLRDGLHRLGAHRWAPLLCEELALAGEEVWRSALGLRYESIVHRYAPRRRSGSLGLGCLLERDPELKEAVQGRLERWLARGAEFSTLADELELALAHARAPVLVA